MEKLRMLVNKHLDFLSLTHEAVLQLGEPECGRTCNSHEAVLAQQYRGRSSTRVTALGAGRSHGGVLLTHNKSHITFHNQTARAARRAKVVGRHAGVASRVGFGDVDNPEASVIQN